MHKDQMSDERLVYQLADAIVGLTCAITRHTDQAGASQMNFRMLESSLRRAQRASRRLKRLASAITRLDESTQ